MHKINYLSHNWALYGIHNKIIEENLHLLQGRVYDFGCGVTPYKFDILRYAEEYIGVDWSYTLHELRADIIADLNGVLPIESESANGVVSFQVLEHLCEPLNMLVEANRVLKSGGVIFIAVPFQWRVHEAPYDYFRFTEFGLAYLLKKAGFVDLEIKPDTGFWMAWILKLNYQTLRLIRGPKYFRRTMKFILVPLWFTLQILAIALNKFDSNYDETTGYFVVAKKP